MEKKRALYISSNLFPVDSGAVIYTYGNILRFAKYFEIDLVSYVQSKDVASEEYYEKLVETINSFYSLPFYKKTSEFIYFGISNRFFFQKYSKAMLKQIKNLLASNDYSYIIIDGFLIYYLTFILRRQKPGCKIILIEHNIEFQNLLEEFSYEKRPVRKILLKLYEAGSKRFEIESWLNSDYILFISERDKSSAEEILDGRKRLNVLPPSFPFRQVKSNDELEKNSFNLLILGNMWWYPNIEGAKWFLEDVFPAIKKLDDRYRVFVVGRNPSELLSLYKSESIVFTGSVRSVDEYIRKCDLLIVPNFSGGGIKIKIYEGIKKGIPVFARPESIVGYTEEIFPESFLASEASDFARKIVEMNRNFELKKKFIDNAQKILKEFEDIEPIVNDMD